jgi:protein-disulfide isomerase
MNIKIVINIRIVIALSTLLLLSPAAARAQRRGGGGSGGGEVQRLRREVEALKEGQRAIEQELRELKELVTADRAEQPASKRYLMNVEGLPFMGERTARLTVVEFSDYQCPYCGQYARETMPQIVRDYVKTGKLKYISGDLPIEEIHPNALKAAKAAACAGEQGKYWEMHDQLFKNQNALGQGELSLHAQAIGLAVLPFQRCLFSEKYDARVREGREVAGVLGIRGTPSFVIGLTGPDGSKMQVLKVVVGFQSYPNFKEVLDRLLTANR